MIRILLDNERFSSKPSKADAARLTTTLGSSEVEIDPYEAAIEIGEYGRTFCPALMKDTSKPRSRSNWDRQMVFGLDFDNNGDNQIVSPDDAIALYREALLFPFACYETFSSTADKPKFRLMFMSQEMIRDYDRAKSIVIGLASIAPDGLDEAVGKDLSRLFYGGKKLLYYEEIYFNPELVPQAPFEPRLPPKKKLSLLEDLEPEELQDFLSLIKGIKKAIADPLKKHTKKPNKLQKGSRYETLLACVSWLMSQSPITLTLEDVEGIILPLVDENQSEWYDIEWDLLEKLEKIYEWSYRLETK